MSVQASPEASHAWSVVARAGAPTWTRLTDCGVEQASAALWMFSLEICRFLDHSMICQIFPIQKADRDVPVICRLPLDYVDHRYMT